MDPAALGQDRYLSAGLRRGNDHQRNWERGSLAEGRGRGSWGGQEIQDNGKRGQPSLGED